MRMTSSAMDRIRELIKQETEDNSFFRISVRGGGCQGFEYDMSMDSADGDDDMRIESDGAVLVYDGVSAPFLVDAVLDWKSDLLGDRFEIDNPIATSSCGCGVSFSV